MKLGAISRITLGLVSLAVALLLAFDLVLHLFPREADTARQVRARVAEQLALQVAALVEAGDLATLQRTLQTVQARSADIESLGLRRADGRLLAHAGAPMAPAAGPGTAADRFVIGIVAGTHRWGALEIAYRPLHQATAAGLLGPQTRLLALFSLFASLLFYLYLRRMLSHLDPSGAVPERVRAAFDALSEGVVIVDPEERILLANDSFHALADKPGGEAPVGRRASSLHWLVPAARDADTTPWLTAMRTREALRGQPFQVVRDASVLARVVLNCSPLLDERGSVRGCLVTLDDVTALERSHEALLAAKQLLEQKNVELEDLANRDGLSGCLNRRAFFSGLEALCERSRRDGTALACILADIDFFKKINDTWGHAIGDEAIQRFSAILRASVREGDLVGRYGGEEFCIAVPGIGPERAKELAESVRRKVAAEQGVGQSAGHTVRMTASFGVAVLGEGAHTAADLVAQADSAMYAAKQSGRNRVIVFGTAPAEQASAETAAAP